MDLATSKGIIDLLRSYEANEKTQDKTHYMNEQATPNLAQNLEQDHLAPRVRRPPTRFISEGPMRCDQHEEYRERKRQQEAAGDEEERWDYRFTFSFCAFP